MQILVQPFLSRKEMKKIHLIAMRFCAKAAVLCPLLGLAIFVVVQALLCSSSNTDNSFKLATVFSLSSIQSIPLALSRLIFHLCK